MNSISLATTVQESLKDGKTAFLVAKGISMRPFIIGMEDRIYISQFQKENIKIGSIYVFIYKGNMIIHRLDNIIGNNLIMRGDGNIRGVEIIKIDDIIGEVIAVQKGKRKIEKGSFIWKTFAYMWPNNSSLRRGILYIYKKINKIIGKNENYR